MNDNRTIPADSIIFDLDGTLWDASSSCTMAWNETLKLSGYDEHTLNEEMIRSYSGLKIENVFDRHFSFIPKEKQAKLMNIYKQQEANFMKRKGGILYPHVKEALGKLRPKFKLFIVSNCLEGYIENFLELNQLQDVFNDFECSGNTNLPKSKNIQLIIERNNLAAPVYVGDTIWDYEASLSNRIPFIYAAYGFGKVENAAIEIQDISELLELAGTMLDSN